MSLIPPLVYDLGLDAHLAKNLMLLVIAARVRGGGCSGTGMLGRPPTVRRQGPDMRLMPGIVPSM